MQSAYLWQEAPINNESVFDLLVPPEKAKKILVQNVGAGGDEIVLTPLREEVVTSLAGPMQVLQREEGNRRTTRTDRKERSSRSHSVFQMVIEARGRKARKGKVTDTGTGKEVIMIYDWTRDETADARAGHGAKVAIQERKKRPGICASGCPALNPL